MKLLCYLVIGTFTILILIDDAIFFFGHNKLDLWASQQGPNLLDTIALLRVTMSVILSYFCFGNFFIGWTQGKNWLFPAVLFLVMSYILTRFLCIEILGKLYGSYLLPLVPLLIFIGLLVWQEGKQWNKTDFVRPKV